MALIEAVNEGQSGWLGSKHGELNYKICNAIDPLQFGIVMEEMVSEGMSPQMAKIFDAQFHGLLAAVRSENNRLAAAKANPKPCTHDKWEGIGYSNKPGCIKAKCYDCDTIFDQKSVAAN